MREDRPLVKSKRTRIAIEDGYAYDVGGQEIAGELNALIRETQCLRKCMGERRFADARNIFNQQVSASEQASERQFDLPLLSQNHLIQLRDRAGEELRRI